jgi:uncharacterized protein (TIGR02145 family)
MKKVSLILNCVLISIMTFTSCQESPSNGEAASSEGVATKEEAIIKQVWMTENLNVDKFRNGESIPEAKTEEEWNQAGQSKQPAWCYYNNDSNNGATFGKIYNWYAVSDPRGLAPEGWKIPTDEEWGQWLNTLGDNSGVKMKSAAMWAENTGFGESGNGTNDSGFSGLPGGVRSYDGKFSQISEVGRWWSSTEYKSSFDSSNAWCYHLSYAYPLCLRSKFMKSEGFSVRCLKD